MRAAWDAAVGVFEKKAALYERTVYELRRVELIEEVRTSLFKVFSAQMRNAERKCRDMFAADTERARSKKTDFIAAVADAKEKAISYFRHVVGPCVVEGTEGSFADAVRQLEKDFDQLASELSFADAQRQLEKDFDELYSKVSSALLEEDCDEHASKCLIADAERQLEGDFVEQASELSSAQLDNLYKGAMTLRLLHAKRPLEEDFDELVSTLSFADAERQLEEDPDDADAERQLEEHLDEHASKARAEAVRDLVDAAKKSVGVAVGEPLAVLLGEGKEEMWDEIQKVVEREARNAAETMQRKMKGALLERCKRALLLLWVSSQCLCFLRFWLGVKCGSSASF